MKPSRRTLVGVALAALAVGGVYLLLRAGGNEGPATEGTSVGSAAGADAAGTAPAAAPTTLASGPAPVVRDARDETVLEGIVLDAETGDAVRGGRVRWGEIEAETDVGGTYRVRAAGALPLAEEIVARADGYLDGSTSCDRQVWSPAGRLEPILLARVRERRPGRVRDGLDRPVEGAVILVGPGRERYVSRADGSFGPVPIGDRGLEWRAFSTREARAEGTWDRDDPAPELEIVMPVAAFADGWMRDEFGPVAGVEVFLLRWPDELRVVTGPDGRFRWPLPSHGVEMLAAAPDFRAGVAEAFAGAPLVLRILRDGSLPAPSSAAPPPSSDPRYGGDADRTLLTSLVVDDRGRPVPGAEVEASAPDRSWRVYERTDAEGRFSLEVYAAPIDIAVAHPLGGDRWTRQLDAAREALPDPVALPPRAARSRQVVPPDPPSERVLRGRVRDAEGRPVPGVKVAADGDLDSTDARGEFLLAGLPPERPAVLTIQANYSPPLPVTVPIGASPPEVILPARGALLIRLRNPSSEWSVGSTVQLSLDGSEGTAWFRYENSGDAGCVLERGDRIRLDLPVGSHVLDFRCSPGGWIRRPGVTVTAGAETVLDYAFPRPVGVRFVLTDPEGVRVEAPKVFLADLATAFTYDSDRPPQLETDEVMTMLMARWDRLVPAGVYRLRVVADGFAPTFVDAVDLRNDATVSLTLARGEACSGWLTARDGALVGPGTLAWRAPFGPPVTLGDVAEDGSFGPLLPLSPGTQVLILRRKGEPDVDVPVDVRPGASGQPLHLRIP